MRYRKVAAGVAALAAAGLAGVVPAGAVTEAPQPTVSFQGGVIVSDGMSAAVHVTYRCSSSISPMNHLFAAVKQGPDVSPENASSETATITTFLSTNWNSDAGPNALVCNGKTQHQKIELQNQPGYPSVPLKSGAVLLQLCVYDNVTGFNGFEPIGGFAPSYTMERAVVTGGAH